MFFQCENQGKNRDTCCWYSIVVGMSCEQVTFHQRDADAQEEQQDGDRSHYDPPEVGYASGTKRKQAPPEEYFAKVVGGGAKATTIQVESPARLLLALSESAASGNLPFLR